MQPQVVEELRNHKINKVACNMYTSFAVSSLGNLWSWGLCVACLLHSDICSVRVAEHCTRQLSVHTCSGANGALGHGNLRDW